MGTNYDGVFEGGGAKGVAFVGALDLLQQAGRWYDRVAGTSAGAITASLIACGYPATCGSASDCSAPGHDECIKGLIFNTQFQQFMDHPSADTITRQEKENCLLMQLLEKVKLPLTPKWVERCISRLVLNGLLLLPDFRFLFNWLEKGGIYEGEVFRLWMNQAIHRRLCALAERNDLPPPSAFPTFSEAKAITQIHLSVVASNLTKDQVLILNENTTPDLAIADAVRMSMSIPFFYRPVIFQGNDVVDGGVISNYPMFLFSEENDYVHNTLEELKRMNLGLMLDERIGSPEPSREMVLQERVTGAEAENERALLGPYQRVLHLVDTMLSARDAMHMKNEYHNRTIRLPVKGYSTIQFQMTLDQKRDLCDRGWSATADFLSQWEGVSALPPNPYAAE
ncbi:MAG: patatin-like phospholipase family protein [Armatimonadetes bacterium]|nr:patatin-like phospholipase family protein [Armatimonadota bacterium]